MTWVSVANSHNQEGITLMRTPCQLTCSKCTLPPSRLCLYPSHPPSTPITLRPLRLHAQPDALQPHPHPGNVAHRRRRLRKDLGLLPPNLLPPTSSPQMRLARSHPRMPLPLHSRTASASSIQRLLHEHHQSLLPLKPSRSSPVAKPWTDPIKTFCMIWRSALHQELMRPLRPHLPLALGQPSLQERMHIRLLPVQMTRLR